jgi:DNA-binding CsgD family transcriptional regulator
MPAAENTSLSEREIEILRLLSTGASNKEIAQQLYISPNTVKVHLKRIFSKLGAESRTEAVMYAIRTGLVAAPAGTQSSEIASGVPEGLGEQNTLASIDRTDNIAIPQEKAIPQAAPKLRIVLRLFAFGLVLVVLLFSGYYFSRSPLILAAATSPAPSRLTELPGLPTPRRNMALAAFENRIYAIGGASAQGVTGIVEQYNPQAQAWTVRTSKPTPVEDAGAVVLSGLIYIPGGRAASGQPVQTLEVYDPRLDTWVTRASLPGPRCAYALAAFEGQLYLFGGWDGSGWSASVWAYDPPADAWSQKASLPSGRGYAAAVTAASKIYVFGGFDGKNMLDENLMYQPDIDHAGENPWLNGNLLPAPRQEMGAAALGDLVLLIGGKGKDTGPLQYSADSGQWQKLTEAFPDKWTGFGLTPLGTQVFLLGGEIDGEITGRNLVYQAIYTMSIPLVPSNPE